MCFSEGDLGYFFSAFRCEKYSFGDSRSQYPRREIDL